MVSMSVASFNKKNLVWQLILFAVISSVVIILYTGGFFNRLEWMTLDARMNYYRTGEAAPENIVAVMIDEASLADMNSEFGRFPWPRGVYADLLEFLALGGARAVVFDILFTENERRNEEELTRDDLMFAAAGSDFGISYHSAQIIVDKKDEVAGGNLDQPLPEDFRSRFGIRGSGFRQGVHNNFFLPYEELYRSARQVGVVGLDADPDGVFRRMRLFREYHGLLYPSLAFTPHLEKFNVSRGVAFEPGAVRVGSFEIPVDAAEDYLINPYGKVQQYSISGIFTSLKMIMSGSIENLLVNPEEFRDKIVFVGASAVGLEDVKATPLSAKTPGVLMHVWACANIQQGDFLQQAGSFRTIAFIVAFALVTMATIFYSSGFLLRIAMPLILLGGYVYFAFTAFENNYVYDIVPPAMAIIAAILTSFTYLSFTEGRDKRMVRKIFSRYVSPEIMTELLEKPEVFGHGEYGRKEDMTILFSDLRGFTTLSETLEAEKVVDLLNCHFKHMTEVIFDNKGTLDKFIGDAIMAFWGAPLKIENHVDQAVRAAVEMYRRLDLVNSELSEKGYPPVAIGIGLNSGEVILGNIGSERKMDYTVIGDNVNLASRLEGLTKLYGCPVLITEFTRERLCEDIICMTVDQVRVKGKQKPIGIYAPLALPEDDGQARQKAAGQQSLAARGFEQYRQRQWQQAAETFAALENSFLAEVYIQRCRLFQETSPPPDWDGVFVATSK